MGVLLRFSPSFYEYLGSREPVEVSGNTVKESIESLITQFPIFKQLLFDQEHSLSALIIFKGEVIVQNQLDKQVGEHAEILILPMVYGG